MPRLSCLLILLLTATPFISIAQVLDPTIQAGTTEQLSEHVYWIPDQKKPIIPNVGIVVGERATLVIDTGLGETNGKIVLNEARKVSKTDRFYVAASHTHPEHDLGAMAFPENATIVRSKAQQQDITEQGMGLAKRFATFSPIAAEQLEGAYIRDSDLIFDTEMTLDLGGVHVRLIPIGPLHTGGDLAFYVEEDDVLFTGDVVMDQFPMPLTPQSKITHWLETLDKLEAIDAQIIVPCHYRTGSQDLIQNYREFFSHAQSRVIELKHEGKSDKEITEVLSKELTDKFDFWSDPGRIPRTIAVAIRDLYQ